MQPGQTIMPGDSENKGEEQIESPVVDTKPELQQEQTAPWQYESAKTEPNSEFTPQNISTVSWTASEFINHEKRVEWFLMLTGVGLVMGGLVYLVTRDFFTTGVVLIALSLFGVTAGRKPNTLDYKLDAKGITIATKLYEYGRFKSFSVIAEGALNSIQLTPVGRFAPPISLYFPPDQQEQIVSTLGNYLPHEERSHDPVDRLMRRIRF